MKQGQHHGIGRTFNILLFITAVTLSGAALFRLQPSAAPPTALLERRLATVNFDGETPKEALKKLGAAAGTELIIEDEDMDRERIDLARPVHLHLQDVDVQTVFACLHLGARGRYALEQRGDALHVINADSVTPVVRIYDVGDLLDRWTRDPLMQREETSLFGDVPRGTMRPPTREELLRELVKLIDGQVDAEKRYLPQDKGVEPAGTSIVVTGPPAFQRETGQFIQWIRDSGI